MSDPSLVLVWLDPGRPVPAAGAHHRLITWNPDAEDGGRTELLTSIRDARELLATQGDDPDQLRLLGIGRGAVAAAGVARYARRLGIAFAHVTCVAPNWNEPDPFSGDLLAKAPEGVELVDRLELPLS